MDEWILFIVCLNEFEFHAPYDILGHEDVLQGASTVLWDPRMNNG